MRTLAACVLALLVAVPASAIPFSWIVEGKFTAVADSSVPEYAGQFAVGQSFTVQFDMDSAFPDGEPQSTCGRYAVRRTTFTSGSFARTFTQGGGAHVVSPTGGPGCGGTLLPGSGVLFDGEFSLLPVLTTVYTLRYLAPLTTDALPIDPSVITSATFTISRGLSSSPIILASADAVTITAVPEPTSAILIGLGLLGFWRRHTR